MIQEQLSLQNRDREKEDPIQQQLCATYRAHNPCTLALSEYSVVEKSPSNSTPIWSCGCPHKSRNWNVFQRPLLHLKQNGPKIQVKLETE